MVVGADEVREYTMPKLAHALFERFQITAGGQLHRFFLFIHVRGIQSQNIVLLTLLYLTVGCDGSKSQNIARTCSIANYFSVVGHRSL